MQTVVILRQRPKQGELVNHETDFEVKRIPIPTAQATRQGECLVKNMYLSLDPTIRGWMNASVNSYLPPIEIGAIMRGGSVGIVMHSKSNLFKEGDYVICGLSIGWAQYGVTAAENLIPIRNKHPQIPLRAYAGVLGGTGLTAYFGLLEIGKPKPGETIVVTAAAGAVGSVVCQIAKKIYNCKVIGLVGGEEKRQWLMAQTGADDAIIHSRPDTQDKLKRAVGKNGIDVLFDNVGGSLLDDCLKLLANKGGARVVLCGAVSQMNLDKPSPIYNLMNLTVKSASMEGFVLLRYRDRYDEAYAAISRWILDGKLVYAEDVVESLDLAPKAFLKLFGRFGGNKGKLVVNLHPEEEAKQRSSL